MYISPNLVEKLCEEAGESRTKKAVNYKKSNRVRILEAICDNENSFEIRALVYGTQNYRTYIEVKNGEIEDTNCECLDYYNHYGICKHTLASVLKYNENYKKVNTVNSFLNSNNNLSKSAFEHRNFRQIVNVFFNEEIENIEDEPKIKVRGDIKLEPKIFYDKFVNQMQVEFRIGNKKMYKLKDLAEFYTRIIEKEFYKYGEKLEFLHTKDAFEESSKPLLEFLLKYAEIIKYANSNINSNYRYYGKALNENSIILGNSGIDDLFEILKSQKVEFQKEYQKGLIEFTDEQPKIEFKLKKISNKEYIITPNVEIFNISIIKGKNYKYVLINDKLHRCTKEFEKSNLKLLELFRQNYLTELTLGEEELSQLFSVIIPKVKNAIKFENISEQDIEKYKPKKLAVKVFLDFDENNYIVADVKFCYENEEFNPLEENIKILSPRNMIAETKALNLFRKSGFMLEQKNLRFILPNDENIYQFLSNDIEYYMQKFEVLVTDNFKSKEIK